MKSRVENKILWVWVMLLSLFFAACSDENGEENVIPKREVIGENLIICNEGNWQSDNGQLSYYDGTAGVLTNKWFRQIRLMTLSR